MREVLDALWDFIKSALEVIGIILLAILIALLLKGFRGMPEGEPMPGMEPVLAGGRGRVEGSEEAAGVGAGETATAEA
jgi:hypothetical protein